MNSFDFENVKNIPQELKDMPNWVLWRAEAVPGRDKMTKVLYNAETHNKASSTNPSSWVCFDQALWNLQQHNTKYAGIGFVLSENDEFAFIDFDNPADIADPALQAEAVALLNQVYAECPQSYTEISPSGNGLHIVLKCDPHSIPNGRRKGALETYTKSRFMTVTGNVVPDRPLTINSDQGYIRYLFDTLGASSNAQPTAQQCAGSDVVKHDDAEVVALCGSFENGDKFNDLFYGRWENHYSSHSEADQALINMLQYVTKNREQIIRIFRSSDLGQRAKAQRDDYVKYSVDKSFDQELPEIDTSALKAQFDAKMADIPTVSLVTMQEEALPTQPQFSTGVDQHQLKFPPGLVGEIASFIYYSSNRPVAEIAIAGALGLMAGICGRAYSINGSGLNLYIVLLAPTGSGKEAINSGINRLINTVATVANDNDLLKFVGPSAISSGQALHRYLTEDSVSFVSVFGEMGLLLNSMSGAQVSESKIGLRKVILDLFSKSDPGQMLQGMAYAKKEDSKGGVRSPAFTMIGESTPERFYEALNEDLVSEGLMPRFTTIEYRGVRVERNKNHHLVKPTTSLVHALAELAQNAAFWNRNDENLQVTMHPDALTLLDNFDIECDKAINDGILKMRSGAGSLELLQNLWNRGHLKALRVAGVIACGLPYVNNQPQVSPEVASWAIELVRSDILAMQKRFEAGDVGSSSSSPEESRQLLECERAIRTFMQSANDPASLISYGVTGKMLMSYCVPYSYLHKKLSALSCFRKDRGGATNAVRRTLETMVNRGDLRPEGKVQMMERFEVNGQGYIIANIANFVTKS